MEERRKKRSQVNDSYELINNNYCLDRRKLKSRPFYILTMMELQSGLESVPTIIISRSEAKGVITLGCQINPVRLVGINLNNCCIIIFLLT